MTPDALVIGFAITGQAATRVLRDDGYRVVAVDDGEPTADAVNVAASLGAELVWRPARAQLAGLADRAELIVLSPGIAPSHPVFAVADSGKIVSEVELAARMATVPVLAITGTNGKTTVTSLVAEIMREAGVAAEAVGNIGRPFVEAVAAGDPEMFVVEVSSFQLAWTREFRPSVACWLNFAEDHLDWHADLDEYAAAKGRIWANQQGDDVAVANATDPVVMKWAARAGGRLVTFGSQGDVGERDGMISSPDGEICHVSELPRSLPHDVTNACAAAAVALAAGAGRAACAAALRRGVAMPHRIELVAEQDGVRWFDDSKATTPAAVLAALQGFASVVLVAGGRNKGLDLSAMVDGLGGTEAAASRLRGVVAIGESASEVAAAFSRIGGLPVRRATSMTEAVELAGELATPGDAVLLSPGCASFDWYRSYGERGDDFARVVRGRLGERAAASTSSAGPAEAGEEHFEHMHRRGAR